MLHQDSAWQPSPPSSRLADTAIQGNAWRAYLAAQGYDEDEIALLLDGLQGDREQQGLAARVRAGLDALDLEARDADAVRGLVVGYLELRPPVSVLELPPAPPRYLSPEQFGRRLKGLGESHELGAVFADRLNGNRWIVAPASVGQAAAMITAGALYLVLGVAAPNWRLVELEGKRRVAVREPTHWHRYKLADQADELQRQAPADTWFAFGPSTTNTRARLHPIPGQPAVIRWDLRQAMGYRGAGRRDSNWGLQVQDLDAIKGSTVVPMLRRIDRLADKRIRRAVAIGGLPDDQAAVFYGTLITRRETLRTALARLTGA